MLRVIPASSKVWLYLWGFGYPLVYWHLRRLNWSYPAIRHSSPVSTFHCLILFRHIHTHTLYICVYIWRERERGGPQNVEKQRPVKQRGSLSGSKCNLTNHNAKNDSGGDIKGRLRGIGFCGPVAVDLTYMNAWLCLLAGISHILGFSSKTICLHLRLQPRFLCLRPLMPRTLIDEDSPLE